MEKPPGSVVQASFPSCLRKVANGSQPIRNAENDARRGDMRTPGENGDDKPCCKYTRRTEHLTTTNRHERRILYRHTLRVPDRPEYRICSSGLYRELCRRQRSRYLLVTDLPKKGRDPTKTYKICKMHMAICIEENIVGLNISVDDVLSMDISQCTAQLCNPKSNSFFRKCLA